MNERAIVIDPGHGGDDPGAVGSGIIEKEYTLLISQYMYDRFKELGIPVYITRETDETLSPTERVERINNAFGTGDNVIVISNHINAGGGDGAEVIYALRNSDEFSKLILSEISKEGQNIRKWYQRRLPSDPELDYYFIHRDTGDTEAVIIEYGFLDSTGDDVEQIKNNYEDYAEAVVRATAQYLGFPYESVEGTYVVQEGDSLYSIARKFDITVDQLKLVNKLTNDLLSIGQILIIPTEDIVVPPEYVTYVVQSGDSLYSIAREYNTIVDELIRINKLTTTLLQIGDQLLVPPKNGIEPEPIPEPEPEGTEIVYVVQSGDNLYSIARKYDITVDQLKSYNNLTSNLLSIGQELKIPVEGEVLIYTVQSGDNLYSIAREYNTTVDELRNINGLTSNLLSLGQRLLIPVN